MTGWRVGAAAFVAYCLATPPLVRHFGAWKGSAAGLLVWTAVARGGLRGGAVVTNADAARSPQAQPDEVTKIPYGGSAGCSSPFPPSCWPA
jgi:hypothetical protein